MTPLEARTYFARTRTCLLIPTYNDVSLLMPLLDQLLPYVADIIIIDDGSTDGTSLQVQDYIDRQRQMVTNLHLQLVTEPRHRGKGASLCTGFRHAAPQGYQYALTIDADGKHSPEDLTRFAQAHSQLTQPRLSILVGERRHSYRHPLNFLFSGIERTLFALQTWQRLPDPQCCYRLYPIDRTFDLSILSRRYEAEIELLVYSSWRRGKFVNVPLEHSHTYSRRDRRHVHFLRDGFRFLLLNIFLFFATIFYGWPVLIYNRVVKRGGCHSST